MNKEEFKKHLMESGPGDLTGDGVVVDDTVEAVKESAFAPVAEEDVRKMESLIAEAAQAQR